MTGAGHSGAAVIGAVGARTPVGLSADGSAAAWRAGISRLGEHPRFVDKEGEPIRTAFDAALDPDLPVLERMCQIAESALHEACEGLGTAGRRRATLMVALPEPRPGWSELDATPVLQRLTAAAHHHVEVERTVPFARGHAAGLLALESATREIESGACELALVGGVDSWLDYRALSWLDQERRLASGANRLGFTPGEAAAFVLVASAATLRSLRLPTLAQIRGVASAHEPKTRSTDEVCLGEGLNVAIRSAASGLSLPEEKIATTYCDINGERYRSEEFMYVPLRVWAPFVDANRYETTADAWGDVGAATGPLLLALVASSVRRGWARGPTALVFAGSDDGARAAAALALPQAPAPSQGATA